MIQLAHIHKSFRTPGRTTTVLTDISLTVNAGDFLAIMGPSGCGKSTLLTILGLIDDADTGQYWFHANDLTQLSERQQDAFRQQHIGIVFQGFNLIDELSVYENVELPLVYLGIGARERKRRIDTVLERLHLMHRRRHRPAQLSGGQQQRAAIARAVISQPQLILADEPTGNLDSANSEQVMQLLSDLNETGTTIIMVTHAEHDALYAHRIIRMRDGKLD